MHDAREDEERAAETLAASAAHYVLRAMAELTVYEKRACTTCRNLAALLAERGIDYDAVDFHVFAAHRADELRDLVAQGRRSRPATCSARARTGLRASSASASARSPTTRRSR